MPEIFAPLPIAAFVLGLASGVHCIGGLVLAFGVFGLARAADLGEAVRRGLLCF